MVLVLLVLVVMVNGHGYGYGSVYIAALMSASISLLSSPSVVHAILLNLTQLFVLLTSQVLRCCECSVSGFGLGH